MELTGKLEITHLEPYKVELAKGQRGSYGWTITVHTITAEAACHQLQKLDAELHRAFPNTSDSAANGNGHAVATAVS
jgi:hypothetical protein